MKLSRLFWIGLTISSSIIIFVFGLLYLQDISLNQASLKFTVMFDNVQGLNDGDNVNMLGKRIGRVSTTKIMGNRIAVEISINQSFSFNIPIDSRIEVKSDGLLGSKFILIPISARKLNRVFCSITLTFSLKNILPSSLYSHRVRDTVFKEFNFPLRG